MKKMMLTGSPDFDFLKKVGAKIKLYRLGRNVSIDELARKTKIEAPKIIKMEGGTDEIFILDILRISNALDMDTKELFM